MSLAVDPHTTADHRKRKARDIDLLSFEQKVQELEEDWVRFIQIQLTTETMDLAKN